jgi:pyruvate dehydrogenase E2 component (dihydrolipoamide acetyltransferase)
MIVARDVFDLESDREAMGVQPLSKTRRTIAERMQVSKQTVPHFYVNAEIDMSQVEQLRRYCVDSAGWQKAPTYTDIFVRASALAVRDLPEVNVQFRDGGILHLSSVGIGVAVSLREGLVVPAISQADLRSLREISIEIKSLSERARNGKLKESDFAGKSLVVSNLGMYGVDSFTAIIDMPASMILAVGRVVDRVVPVNKQPEVRPMCTINLSVDHRVLDGVDGARFLKRIRDILENPFEIMGGTT